MKNRIESAVQSVRRNTGKLAVVVGTAALAATSGNAHAAALDFSDVSAEITSKIASTSTFLGLGIGLLVVFVGYKLIKRGVSKI